MTKVYPNTTTLVTSSPDGKGNAAILTVWKKSLLFSCNGFTVFDSKGDLVFRVDNYMASNKGEIVLMDAAGKPLYTIRRKVQTVKFLIASHFKYHDEYGNWLMCAMYIYMIWSEVKLWGQLAGVWRRDGGESSICGEETREHPQHKVFGSR